MTNTNSRSFVSATDNARLAVRADKVARILSNQLAAARAELAADPTDLAALCAVEGLLARGAK